MGKIKSKLIRKTAKNLSEDGVEFNENFIENKKILNSLNISKKIRNQLAGLIAKNKKREIQLNK